jgi:integration host factor subunit beta
LNQLKSAAYYYGDNVTKSELIRALSDKLPEHKAGDVELAVNHMLKQMMDALIEGQRIEIRGFGSLDLRHRASRKTRNPKTGEAVNLGSKVVVHFKPGKEMRDWVNAMRGECEIRE